jgi:hypothetical protein
VFHDFRNRLLDSGPCHLRGGELNDLDEGIVTIALHPISKFNLEVRAKDFDEWDWVPEKRAVNVDA